MKKKVLIIVLIAIIISGCHKEEESNNWSAENPYYALDSVSLSFVPYTGTPTLVFFSDEGMELRLKAKNGVELDTVWNYNQSGTSFIYYNEFRRVRFTGYNQDSLHLQILVDSSVKQSVHPPNEVLDVLSVFFWDNYSVIGTSYPMDFKLMTSNRGNVVTLSDIRLSQEAEYSKSLTLSGRTFTDVYKDVSPHGLEMYCAKNQGLVAFKDKRRLWVLDRVE